MHLGLFSKHLRQQSHQQEANKVVKLNISKKRVLIDKANTTMVVAFAACSFIIVSSLMAGNALLSQRKYQANVIAEKTKARDQLKKNVKAVDSLSDAYKKFVEPPVNLIGGSSTGKSQRDGDNAKLILDALPSKYDFPALTSSLEKILVDNHFKIDEISGKDDEVAQQASTTASTAIEIPYNITVDGNYASIQNLIKIFEHSIRPFSINTIEFSGSDNSMKVVISSKTYYLPEKTLVIKTKDVR